MASETSSAGTQPEPVSSAGEQATTGVAGVWDVYFGQPAPPQGGVNWDAYSHEELYQMLWQDADVADVSTVAAEWAEHRAALVNHAEVLREQRAALLESWRGTGAEEAARRLDVLADRVEKIAALAHAGEQAAEQAADALARARAMMPPPPGDPAAPMTDPAANWAGLGTAPTTSAPATAAPAPADWAALGSQFQPAPFRPSTTTSDAGSAFGAVGGAGFSFYTGAGTADMQKQQAVRAMQGYETSLTSSSELIGQARGTIPAAASTPTSATSPSSTTSASASPSWQSLVGSGGGARGLAPGATTGTLTGGGVTAGLGQAAGLGGIAGLGQAGNALAQGMRVGSMALHGGPASAAQLAAEAAASRPGAMGGMVPPGAAGARPSSDDEEHENQLPTIDHELFPLEEPGSEAVIGLAEEVDQ
ncbi:hypothetical protein [Prauserella flavalba]|uniref:PPE family domain-containing protein n=1 Tax=Prauserella flavalba TaxID=1477506 RepID=A0A318LPN5_9PSEU|nr:hypothetical protein [Prauserella flavalba]PXY36341.1 hypothetical protein BA062_13080 [Prauserella flavalba]